MNKYTRTVLSERPRRNGDRHLERAIAYISAGKFNFADGSLRKARREFDKAEAIDKAFATPIWMEPIYTALRDRIAKNIFETGTGSSGGLADLFHA